MNKETMKYTKKQTIWFEEGGGGGNNKVKIRNLGDTLQPSMNDRTTYAKIIN